MTRPLRILHLENELRYAEVVRSLLQRSGMSFEVSVARNFLEYERLLPALTPDLILSDFDVGGPVGFDALDLARQRDPEVPFIILSGSMDEQQMLDALKRGASGFVHKTRSKELLPTVQRVLGERDKRKSAEETARRMAWIVGATTDFVGIADLDGRVLYVNAAGRRMVGLELDEELSDLRIEHFHPPEVIDLLRTSAIPKALSEGSWSGDGVLKTRDGRLITVSQVVVAPRGPDGKVEFLATIMRDMTERKRVEELLRLSEERLQLAVQGAIDGLWDWNLRTGEIYYSPRWKRMLGYSDDEIKPAFFEWESRLHPDDRERAMTTLSSYLKGETEFYELEHRLRHKDGGYRWTLARGAAIRDAGGEPFRMAGSHNDITLRKEQEEQLKRSDEQLRQAQKMDAIGRLAGGVAHDFNNILTAILGYAELAMMRVTEGDPLRADIEEIKKAGERAASLTRQLLAFSRKQVMQQSVLNLGHTLSEMENMLRRVIGESIELNTVLGPALGRVKADTSQIEQVILNLAVNARDAMPTGGKLTIETANVDIDAASPRVRDGLKPGPYVLISVTDTGTGMSDKALSHIFEPFFTTKEKGKGTGLGLSTVFGIVQQSQGHISVESAQGKGTCFRIYLPRTDDATDKLGRMAPAGADETILVVEEEAVVRQFLTTALRKLGYTVIEAANANEGDRVATDLTRKLDLIITDVALQGQQGVDVVQRATRSRRNLRVLYLAGMSEKELGERGPLPPRSFFLQKPISTAALASKVREVLKPA